MPVFMENGSRTSILPMRKNMLQIEKLRYFLQTSSKDRGHGEGVGNSCCTCVDGVRPSSCGSLSGL